LSLHILTGNLSLESQHVGKLYLIYIANMFWILTLVKNKSGPFFLSISTTFHAHEISVMQNQTNRYNEYI